MEKEHAQEYEQQKVIYMQKLQDISAEELYNNTWLNNNSSTKEDNYNREALLTQHEIVEIDR